MKKFNIKNNNGMVMLLVSVLFLSFSLIVIFGLTGPMIKQIGASHDIWKSRESYYVSEAGIEDISYRIKSGMNYNALGEQIVIGDNLAEISFVGTPESIEGMKVTSEGDASNYIKRVQMTLKKGEGVSFVYGIQTGRGGFYMDGSSHIIGNLYSNGNIFGTSGTYITGSAISANSPSVYTDQENSSPIPPPNSIVFGDANATQDLAQGFKVGSSSPVSQVAFYIKKAGSPANATVKIVKDSSGNPSSASGDLLTSGTLNAAQVTTSYGWIEVAFTSTPTLTPGTQYWLVIDGTTGSASNKYTISANLDNSYTNGTAKKGRLGSSWTATTLDSYFKLYLGGSFGKIYGESQWNLLRVGTVGTGSAHAHTVNFVNATGDIRCKSALYNNKACDTSYEDPTFANYPISDANIEAWKDVALAGGVYNGNYNSPSYGTSSISAKKIVGNLNVSGSHTLYMKGTLWITGSINLSGSAKIVLDPATYGSQGGVMVADGRVVIPGSTRADGTGQAGSYMLVITTSDCPTSTSCGGLNAMEISGSGGAVILNAQRGTLSFTGSAGAKEATANRIVMTGSTVVTYESGLANPSFIDGPSGGFNISSWGEVQ